MELVDSTHDSFTFLPVELQRSNEPDVWVDCDLRISDPVGVLHLDGSHSVRSLDGMVRGARAKSLDEAFSNFFLVSGKV